MPNDTSIWKTRLDGTKRAISEYHRLWTHTDATGNRGGNMNILQRPDIQARLQAMSQSTGVPLELLNAQIMKESSGNPNAIGDSGQSIGLGQIYDPTWAMLQGRNPDLQDRTDPMQNIQAMEDLWNINLGSTGGDVREALRMYNGSGPMAEQYAESLMPRLSSGGQGGGEIQQYQPPQAPGVESPLQPQPMQAQGGYEHMQEATPLQAAGAGLATIGTSPSTRRGGFGGGFASAYGAASQFKARDKARMSKMRFDYDQIAREERYRDKRDAADDLYRQQKQALAREKFTHEQQQDAIEGELSTSPEWMPPMYGGDPAKYFTQADKIGDQYRKQIGTFDEGAQHFARVKALAEAKPDFEKWSVPDVQIAVKSLEKFLDPTSVVRGSEAAAYEQGASVIEKAQKWISSKAEGGPPMPADQIEEIVRALNRVYKASLPQAERVRQGFTQRGTQRGVISDDRNDAFNVIPWETPIGKYEPVDIDVTKLTPFRRR